ncbi:sugar transporter ERD6-like 5 [Pyrus communis]|uniref:sugar transporter ERD6-like 5 n=1 Tax=Pyrus communis TaxID=23211 RepID=UPI0035BF02B9
MVVQDDWTRAAMTDDVLVVELLLRLKQVQAAGPSSSLQSSSPMSQSLLTLRWSVRTPRSKAASSGSRFDGGVSHQRNSGNNGSVGDIAQTTAVDFRHEIWRSELGDGGGQLCLYVHSLNRSALYGAPSTKLSRSRSCGYQKPRFRSIRRACSASLDAFSDEEFSKKIQEFALRFQLSDNFDGEDDFNVGRNASNSEPEAANSVDNHGISESATRMRAEPEAGWFDLFSSRYWKVVSVGAALFLLQQMAGINAVVYYSTSVFRTAGITSDVAASALVGLANVFGTVVASSLMGKQGRKSLLLTSFGGMAASMLLLSLSFTWKALAPYSAPLSVAGTVLYVLSFSLGAGPVPALLLPEIFASRIRAKAVSLSLGMHWISNFVIGLYVLSLVTKFGIGTVYFGFAGVCLLAVLYIAGNIVETKGRSLEEIERALSVVT